MEYGEERTEGIFHSAIADEPPRTELCTLPISRPIVYPDTSWHATFLCRIMSGGGTKVVIGQIRHFRHLIFAISDAPHPKTTVC
jgi:hypothetical protein